MLAALGLLVAGCGGTAHSSTKASKARGGSVVASTAFVSRCSLGKDAAGYLHGKTVLSGIPSGAATFRFDFIGGGLTGHGWHTDWLPNDHMVKNGTFWIYTLGDSGTTPSGVTAELRMSDGSTATTDLQECY